MSDGTHIEWTNASWNVASGCTRVSAGCSHCYIERTPPFRMAGRRFDGPDVGATTGVMLHPERLMQPVAWKKPRRIFVCSLADLFHKDIPDAHIAKTWATMARTPQHTYQVLTKRPARMRSLLRSWDFELMVEAVCGHHDFEWPLPNVWCGTSVENQETADLRIPILLDAPAAVRWISAEPLLGPVDLAGYLGGCSCAGGFAFESTSGAVHEPGCGDLEALSWVVAGGESGPGARPLNVAWIRRIVQDCQQSGVPVLVKQLGSVWARDMFVAGLPVSRHDPKGGDPENWPADLQVRQYPREAPDGA